MKRLTIKLILGLLLSLLFTLPSLGDSTTKDLTIKKGNTMIEQNSTLAPFTLNDQFGNEHNVTKMPKLLICSFGKTSGTLIGSYFNAQSEDYLTQHNIKLMADVSGVPSLLRKAIIIPKMKKNSFSILLITDKEFSKPFPQQDDSLTVLKIEGDVVQEISFVHDESTLKEAIEG